MKRSPKNKKKGFSLIELVVVIAVLAAIAAVLVPSVTSIGGAADKASTAASANQINNTFSQFVAAMNYSQAEADTLGTTIATAISDTGAGWTDTATVGTGPTASDIRFSLPPMPGFDVTYHGSTSTAPGYFTVAPHVANP